MLPPQHTPVKKSVVQHGLIRSGCWPFPYDGKPGGSMLDSEENEAHHKEMGSVSSTTQVYRSKKWRTQWDYWMEK